VADKMTEPLKNETNTTLPFTRERSIILPSPELENFIAIRRLDMERIKRDLEQAKQKKPKLELVYPFLFGMTITCGVSIATFYAGTQSNLPSWVYPLFYLLFVFSLAIGIIFVKLDENLKRNEKSEIDDIIDNLKKLEETFPK